MFDRSSLRWLPGAEDASDLSSWVPQVLPSSSPSPGHKSPSWRGAPQTDRSIFISSVPLPEPNVCRFVSDTKLTDRGRANITDWGSTSSESNTRAEGTKKGKDRPITKEAIFHYVYAVLHDPVYREKYAQNLKREFPRIPFYTRTSGSGPTGARR